MKNDELHWSKNKPTTPGWYWYQKLPMFTKDVVQVMVHKGVLYVDWGNDFQELVKEMDSEWAGPLEPPT